VVRFERTQAHLLQEAVGHTNHMGQITFLMKRSDHLNCEKTNIYSAAPLALRSRSPAAVTTFCVQEELRSSKRKNVEE
jgi:hypothetical protein